MRQQQSTAGQTGRHLAVGIAAAGLAGTRPAGLSLPAAKIILILSAYVKLILTNPGDILRFTPPIPLVNGPIWVYTGLASRTRCCGESPPTTIYSRVLGQYYVKLTHIVPGADNHRLWLLTATTNNDVGNPASPVIPHAPASCFLFRITHAVRHAFLYVPGGIICLK
jgi:hypothetical protein